MKKERPPDRVISMEEMCEWMQCGTFQFVSICLTFGLLMTHTAFLVYAFEGNVIGILFSFFFCTTPLVISFFLSYGLKNKVSLIAAVVSSFLYTAWFFSIILYFKFHPDAQAGLAIFASGIYSLPVMIPLWLFAIVWEGSHMEKEKLKIHADDTP